MHLTQRAYIVLLLTAVLAITGVWSSDPAFLGLWRLPAFLLLLGLAMEGLAIQRTAIVAEIETAPRAFLGREQPAVFTFQNHSSRSIDLEYALALADGFEAPTHTRRVVAPAHGIGRDLFTLLPVRLGQQTWPILPSRLLGPWGLAWWSRTLRPSSQVTIEPDTVRMGAARTRLFPSGMRVHRAVGAGAELHQLRSYRYGDPLARIDWKATARTRQLVTREFDEDQHLDILIAIDAGRFSRVRVGALDRFGLYANAAARFAELATPNDDRVGLLVFSDRPLVVCPPARGLRAVARVRQALEGLRVAAAESDPTAAAVRIRGLLKRRGLVILLTDLDDTQGADSLAKAVQLLSPPHFVLVAGVRSPEIASLAAREARSWSDPWVALAAQEHEARVNRQRLLLRRLGAPVVVAPADLLEKALLSEYESLRRSRRV